MPDTFADLDLLPTLQATLAAEGFVRLTPVQREALPLLLDRKSVLAVAETGSGKTLTWVLPILDRLKRMELDGNAVDQPGEPRAIVIVPTRELGEQVAKVFKTFTHDTRLRVRTLLGGQRAAQRGETLAGAFEVLVATPGRLGPVIDAGTLSLAAVRIVVLDEADELLSGAFRDAVLPIVHGTPSWRQVILTSATLSDDVKALCGRVFADAERVVTAGQGKPAPTLRTRYVDVPDGQRLDALLPLLAERTDGGTILFANTREQVDALAEALQARGHAVAVLRGELDAVARRRLLVEFRDGAWPLLLTTDMTARGLDVPHVGRVINVHLPRSKDAWLHRIGRTARAGRAGEVIHLVTPRDAPLLDAIGDGRAAPAVARRPKPATPRGASGERSAARPGGSPARPGPRPPTHGPHAEPDQRPAGGAARAAPPRTERASSDRPRRPGGRDTPGEHRPGPTDPSSRGGRGGGRGGRR